MKRSKITKTLIAITLLSLIAVFYILEGEQSKISDELKSLELIYNGCYDIEENNNTLNGKNDTEINICFHDENVGYDEKNIMVRNPENEMIRGFNSYYIKYPAQESVEETVWFLCKEDSENRLLLLNEENEVVGQIFYKLDNRSISYFWQNGDEIIPIYKCSDAYYNFGKAYLKSQYYSGYIPE